MNMHITARAERARDDKRFDGEAKPVSARVARKPKTNRAPQRPRAAHQMQQGATMAYQQGFTSGPLS